MTSRLAPRLSWEGRVPPSSGRAGGACRRSQQRQRGQRGGDRAAPGAGLGQPGRPCVSRVSRAPASVREQSTVLTQSVLRQDAHDHTPCASTGTM